MNLKHTSEHEDNHSTRTLTTHEQVEPGSYQGALATRAGLRRLREFVEDHGEAHGAAQHQHLVHRRIQKIPASGALVARGRWALAAKARNQVSAPVH